MAPLIRTAEDSDVGALLSIYGPLVVGTAISFETRVPSEEEMRARVRLGLMSHPWLVVEQDGQVLAEAHATAFRSRPAYRWSVETSVYVAEQARGRGLARALYQALEALLRLQGHVTAWAGITLPNPASVSFHESMGFEPAGRFEDVGYKLGAWRAVGFWRKRLREPPEDPREPIPYSELRLRPEAVAACREPFGTV